MNEPTITINGITLSQGQAMTLRVALQHFLMDMPKPNALGDDEVGQSIANGYKTTAQQINHLIHTPQHKTFTLPR